VLPGYGHPPTHHGYLLPPSARPYRNGLAIAGFVLSLLGGLLIGPILCLVALHQIRRTGAAGRNLAVAGLVVSGAWLALVAVAVTVAVATSADRDGAGRIVDAGAVRSTDLRPGDCLARVPTEATASVDAVPCGTPHQAQVLDAFPLPAGSYPGEDEVTAAAEEGCAARVSDELATRADDGELGLTCLYPLSSGWRAGDREITCLVTAGTEPLTEVLAPAPGLGA
jgi:hypothetical protein